MNLDSEYLDKLEDSKDKMDYAMNAYKTCSKNLEMLKLNVRNMIEDDRVKFKDTTKTFEYEENMKGIQKRSKKQLSEIIKIFENEGLSEFFEPAREGVPTVDGLEAFDEKLQEMVSRLSDFEHVKAAALKMTKKVEKHHNTIRLMSEEADALNFRYSVSFACSILLRHLPPGDCLNHIYILPSVLASITHRNSTSNYYKGVLDKLIKRLLGLVEMVEKERNPTSTVSVTLATLPSSSLSSSFNSLKSTQKSGSVSSTIFPQPAGVKLVHGEVYAPEEILIPVAKDSQLTMAMKATPTPVLPNGEVVKTMSDTKIGPKDSQDKSLDMQ